MMYTVQDGITKFLSSFKEFSPEPARRHLTIDQAIDKLKQMNSGD